MDVRTSARLRSAPPLVAALLAGLLLAGCSGSADDSGDSSAGSGTAPAAAAPAAPQEEPQGAADPRSGQTGTTLGTPNRPLVYTGSLAVTAKDVPDAAARAISATLAAGGHVAADERHVTGPDDDVTATLTLKVPSARFTAMVDTLAALGDETSRRLGTEDLQASTIDVDSRIAAQRASVNRVRALLARANSITELAAIERELTARESELAASEAAKRTMNDRVSYSTITLSLTEPSAPPKAEPEKERGLLVGLRNGWSAFVTTVVVLLTILGWLAPFLIGLAIVGLPIWWALRRFRPRRTHPVSPAGFLPAPHAFPAPPAPPAPHDEPSDDPGVTTGSGGPPRPGA